MGKSASQLKLFLWCLANLQVNPIWVGSNPNDGKNHVKKINRKYSKKNLDLIWFEFYSKWTPGHSLPSPWPFASRPQQRPLQPWQLSPPETRYWCLRWKGERWGPACFPFTVIWWHLKFVLFLPSKMGIWCDFAIKYLILSWLFWGNICRKPMSKLHPNIVGFFNPDFPIIKF